jgi:hypothetical protein
VYTQGRSSGGYSGLAGFWGAAPPKITPEMLQPLPQMATVGPSPELHDPLVGPVPLGPPIMYPQRQRAPRVIVVRDGTSEAEKMPEYVLPAIVAFIIALIFFKK